jgi:hypothetical protein
METLLHSVEPKIVRPFTDTVFQDLQAHVREVRRTLDWPGIMHHEERAACWRREKLPLLNFLHNKIQLRHLANTVFGRRVKPTTSILYMYGQPSGACDTVVYRLTGFLMHFLVASDGVWPIFVRIQGQESKYELIPGQALCYYSYGGNSYHEAMSTATKTNFANIITFCWMPEEWQGV